MAMHINELTIIRPDDWHLHLRDGEAMKAVLKHSALRFHRGLVMPNLKPAITTVKAAVAYYGRIMEALPSGSNFIPLMTLYLTDKTTPKEIRAAKKCGLIHAVKYYPAGATTNSDSGVTDITKTSRALEMMEKVGLPLCVHGEVTDPNVDVFDREKAFIDRELRRLAQDHPALKIVFEHVTTKQGVQFVKSAGANIAATITAHHLLLNRNALFACGICPHHYCLPVLKREEHRYALIEAATSDNQKFFLGTDSAPHPRHLKESSCGCAGLYTAHAGIELYAEAFEQADALDKLEAFASLNGPKFYGLNRSKSSVTLEKISWTVPEQYPFGNDVVVPFRAGKTISWKLRI